MSCEGKFFIYLWNSLKCNIFSFDRNLDLKDYLVDDPKILKNHPKTCYDLVANIPHDGEPGKAA